MFIVRKSYLNEKVLRKRVKFLSLYFNVNFYQIPASMDSAIDLKSRFFGKHGIDFALWQFFIPFNGLFLWKKFSRQQLFHFVIVLKYRIVATFRACVHKVSIVRFTLYYFSFIFFFLFAVTFDQNCWKKFYWDTVLSVWILQSFNYQKRF